jgi:hypothetical protein
MVQRGLVRNVPTYPFTLLDFDPDFNVELTRVANLASSHMADNIANFILASDDAEFDMLQQQAIEHVRRLGLEELWVTVVEEFERSYQTVEEFMREFR